MTKQTSTLKFIIFCNYSTIILTTIILTTIILTTLSPSPCPQPYPSFFSLTPIPECALFLHLSKKTLYLSVCHCLVCPVPQTPSFSSTLAPKTISVLSGVSSAPLTTLQSGSFVALATRTPKHFVPHSPSVYIGVIGD